MIEDFLRTIFTWIGIDAGNPTGVSGAHLNGFIGREVRPWPEPIWFDEVAMPMAVESLANYARHGVTLATGHMSAATMTVLNRMFHEQNDELAIRVYPGLDFMMQNPNGEMFLKRIGNLVDFSLSDDRGEMITIVGTAVGPHTGSEDAAASLLSIETQGDYHSEYQSQYQWFIIDGPHNGFTGLSHDDLTESQKRQTDFHNVMLARQHGWNVTGIHNRGSEGIRLAMQNVYEAENQDKLYVSKLFRPQGFDHNIDWVQEVFDYYNAHPELKALIRFGVNLGTMINQRDAEPLGITNVFEAQYGYEGLKRIAPLKSIMDNGIQFHIEGTEPGENRGFSYLVYTKSSNSDGFTRQSDCAGRSTGS